MTEDEAKTKWCPFVRIVTGTIAADKTSQHASIQPAYNRVAEGHNWAFPGGGCCIASACMAWRWVAIWNGSYNDTFDPSFADGGPHSTRTPNFSLSKTDGYCGLAGGL